ncbi:peptide/nickel transport system permease protein [Agreia bicolorata]|uniref:Peptide/nickel transport system permease protein n=1 Tax=Agreia bicolorata TaxID=110935 RepID=A0A1T4WYQ2_9MICO|nr:ABC transporter permease [Agreia bicolorata]KJC63641.1 hypothetical protein TZ00_14040 [Agreia bicolorata]SKA81731.1 peptide/nickel transport system permease protein [Agreia bicolorata]
MPLVKLARDRLLASIPTLIAVSLIVFFLARATSIDPVVQILGQTASSADRAQLAQQLGLNDSLIAQYWRWLTDAVRGDLGESFFTHLSVSTTIMERLSVTLSIVAVATLLAVVVGVGLGIVGATRPGSFVDNVLSTGIISGLALPSFWLAMLLALFFGVQLGWFPAVGFVPIGEDFVGWLRTVTLPAVALAVPAGAVFARQMRSSLIETLDKDYVVTLLARGVNPRRILFSYAVKNALVPLLSVVSIQVAIMIGASFVVETVFGIQGLGTYLIDAIVKGDYPALEGAALAVGLVVIIVNFVVDIAYGVANPKVRPQ